MIELPFIFLAGLLGSAHCVGMCGGFALAIGAHAPGWTENLLRQGVYTFGRVFTYAWLGMLAGYGGSQLHNVSDLLPAVLAIVAGLFLIYQGLVTTGVVKPGVVTGNAPCLAGSMFGSLLRGSRRTHVLLAGIVTGFLPCGLLYGMLATAGSSSNLYFGALLMATFGLGTMPVMVLTGTSGSLLGIAGRKRLFWLAGWCVVVTGLITLGRGLYAGWSWYAYSEAACPFCP